MERDWENCKLDANYLLDSGLIFEINRSFLHLVGLSLVVTKNPETDSSTLSIIDNRKNPENLLFKKETFEKGNRKLRRFMKEYGWNQMKRRQKILGFASQSWFVPEKKRHPNEQ
jgi:hypothetical protein